MFTTLRSNYFDPLDMHRLPDLFRTAVLLAALGCLFAGTAVAQDASADRVLRTWSNDVKLEDGTSSRWTFAITYDAEAGEYARTVTDQSGVLVERTVETMSLTRPTAEEIARAREVIFDDSELTSLFEQAGSPELSGGFVLQREAGHACGPGSRCLQFDMFDVDSAARKVVRIRYVIVDARTWTLVSEDFNPSTDGNATRFNRNPTLDN